jgi:putative transposase
LLPIPKALEPVPAWLVLLLAAVSSVLKSRAALQLENLALRHQIGVLQRSANKRPPLQPADRLLWVWLFRIWRDWRSSLVIVKPETVVAWHRNAFRLFWTWKIRRGEAGRPTVPHEIRVLIRRMSKDNPRWGAPRIHGELLKLGINIGETSVSKYLVRNRKPPSQAWRTFLENHVNTLVSIDFFTVPTIRFQILYVFLVLAHERRRILHFAVTAHPTTEWAAHQLREAFPWETAPRYLLRDRDRIFGREFVEQVKAMGNQAGAVGTAGTVAARVYRARDRHDPSRVFGSRHRFQRTQPPLSPAFVHWVLSSDSHAFGIAKGQSGTAPCSNTGGRTDYYYPRGWRPPSSVRAPSCMNGNIGQPLSSPLACSSSACTHLRG